MSLPLLVKLQRRRVFRALVGYATGSFAVLQIIEPIVHGLHWFAAVVSYAVVALAVGFPLLVGLAWIFDVNSGRIERTSSMPSSGLRGAPPALLPVAVGLIAAQSPWRPGLVLVHDVCAVVPSDHRSIESVRPQSGATA